MAGEVRGNGLSGNSNITRNVACRIIDVLLFAAFVALMVFPINYGVIHEWAGVAAFALVIAHIAINVRRIAGLARKHDLAACVNLTIEFALLLGILAIAASSLVLSEHAFAWLPAIPGASWARSVHLCVSYWIFALAFVHFGLHLQGFLGRLSRRSAAKWALRMLFLVCLISGIWSFAELRVWSYMTLQMQFAFVDPDIAVGFLQYGSMAIALTGCGHCIGRIIRCIRKNAVAKEG